MASTPEKCRIAVVIDPSTGRYADHLVICAVQDNGDLLLLYKLGPVDMQRQENAIRDQVQALLVGRDPAHATVYIVSNTSLLDARAVAEVVAPLGVTVHHDGEGRVGVFLTHARVQGCLDKGHQQALPENHVGLLTHDEAVCVGLARDMLGL